jgi:2-dehydro-3-deoxyphosphogluconate aldolase/(4S)-4-hydroxy-2-oxoglutarate aldolase
VELTFTTPDVLGHVGKAAAAGLPIGVGTVLTADQARGAIDAGIPVFLGAFTPTEVARAMDLGAAAVKIFPAGRLGPKYLPDLHGPYPDVQLLPSGGVSAENAADYLGAGALAVCAGTSVVPPAAVEAGAWSEITERARTFAAALTARRER